MGTLQRKDAMKTSFLSKTALGFALTGAALIAHAETFSCAAGSSQDCALATSSLSWTWDGTYFTLTNGGSGYVSEVYFDLGAGMAASFYSGVGTVNFAAGANPSNLPGGSSVDFVSDAAFDSDASGKPIYGINLGESATFKITGAALGSFSASDIAAGAHVRSLVDSSASVVTVSAVPEPDTYALLLAGLGAAAWGARRRSRA